MSDDAFYSPTHCRQSIRKPRTLEHVRTLDHVWSLLAVVVAFVPFVAACNRVAPTVSCQGLRQLRFGMSETEVEQALGPPLKVSRVCCAINLDVPADVAWVYHEGSLSSGRVSIYWPSTTRISVSFQDGRMLLASVSKRIYPFGDEHTLFVVDKNEVRETKGFRDACD
jgi:hypothetical protein